ncbi:hypothetical protein BKA81DRAFT_379136 [Phyllosticta paracitricarpa]|uniref:Uncharacterized protein n=1 Tax=Phyllosticta citricarpa TaxID=55181 RepID=A0ABR1MQ45_9PEZI
MELVGALHLMKEEKTRREETRGGSIPWLFYLFNLVSCCFASFCSSFACLFFACLLSLVEKMVWAVEREKEREEEKEKEKEKEKEVERMGGEDGWVERMYGWRGVAWHEL